MDRLVNSRLYKRHIPVNIDGKCKFYEIITKKQTIVDKVPIATAFFILGNAKLCVLSFVNDIESCLLSNAMRLLYMGEI